MLVSPDSGDSEAVAAGAVWAWASEMNTELILATMQGTARTRGQPGSVMAGVRRAVLRRRPVSDGRRGRAGADIAGPARRRRCLPSLGCALQPRCLQSAIPMARRRNGGATVPEVRSERQSVMATSTPPPGDDDGAPRAPGGMFDNDLSNTVKQSAQQIWLAGLGAFAKAQEEGSKVFEALVREGTSLQRRTTRPAEEQRADDAGSRSTGAFGGLAGQATQQWDRLESIFEDRVAKALNRLGVPSLKDMAALQARVDELAAEVARLSAATPAADDVAGTATRRSSEPDPA